MLTTKHTGIFLSSSNKILLWFLLIHARSAVNITQEKNPPKTFVSSFFQEEIHSVFQTTETALETVKKMRQLIQLNQGNNANDANEFKQKKWGETKQ